MLYTIDFDLIIPDIKASNRKQAIGEIARRIAPRVNCHLEMLQSALLEREYESSSAVGDGVAIPNLKLEGLQKRFVVLTTLHTPVDFQAIDDQKVDIICVLLSPEADGPIHLRGLSRITRMFKNDMLREKLRETNDADIMRSLLVNPEGWLLAA